MTTLQRAEEIGAAVLGAFDVLRDHGRLHLAQRLRIATRLCLYSLRILGGSTMTMQREQLLRMDEEAFVIPTRDHTAGWHWCAAFDFDLVDPWSSAIVCCQCELPWRGRLRRAIVRVVYFIKWDVLGGRQRALKEIEREFLK